MSDIPEFWHQAYDTDTNYNEADKGYWSLHPRHSCQLFGHRHVFDTFCQRFQDGKTHHAWLLCGAQGIGKATLAWAIARALLDSNYSKTPMVKACDHKTMLAWVDATTDTPVNHRISALSEPDLLLIRRGYDPQKKTLKTDITVDDVRQVNRFLGLQSASCGWRVIIVDSVDEMNINALNALLKLLEEPPSQTIFLMVCHHAQRLLETIKSRCTSHTLAPLSQSDFIKALKQANEINRLVFDAEKNTSENQLSEEIAYALFNLCQGSVGQALLWHHLSLWPKQNELIKILKLSGQTRLQAMPNWVKTWFSYVKKNHDNIAVGKELLVPVFNILQQWQLYNGQYYDLLIPECGDLFRCYVFSRTQALTFSQLCSKWQKSTYDAINTNIALETIVLNLLLKLDNFLNQIERTFENQ